MIVSNDPKQIQVDLALLRAIFNHHFQLTGLLDTCGRLLMANETAITLIGVRETDIVGKYFWETPWWGHSESIKNKLKSAIQEAASGKFVRFETTHRSADHKLHHFDFSLSPLFDQKKRVMYLIPEARDITELKLTKQSLQNALAEVNQLKERLENENDYLRGEIRSEHDSRHIVGQSPAFRRLLNQVEQVANTDATVLILGETGTGKELIARTIHDISDRRDHPMVTVNCAALPANLIESELFGYEKGAFTGAVTRKLGRFELANQGTIFLDEIGDIPIESQARLLRVLQEGEFERLGSEKTLKVQVRTVAATNRDLRDLIRRGEFREDLYYRLNVFPIQLPALRNRKEDIPALIEHFVDKYSPNLKKKIDSIPQKAMKALMDYHWPGNIRELENIIERALIISGGNQLELGDWFLQGDCKQESKAITTLREHESAHILKALERTSWRVSGPNGAAKLLGLKPTTLEARMKKLGITRNQLSKQ